MEFDGFETTVERLIFSIKTEQFKELKSVKNPDGTISFYLKWEEKE